MFVPINIRCRVSGNLVAKSPLGLLTIHLVAFTLLFGLPNSVIAQADDGITLQSALGRALGHHPRLAVFPYQLRAAEARALQANARPNPELSLEIESVAGSGELEGAGSAETTLVLSQVIELGGKRGNRRDVARLNTELARRDYQIARLEILADTAERFLAVVAARRILDLAELAQTLAERSEQAVRVRVDAGRANRAELNQARIEALRADLVTMQARNQLDNARLRLAANWGATEPDFASARADLFDMPDVPEFASFTRRLDQAPELTRYLTLERLRQAELALAQSRGRQDLRVGVGVQHFGDTGEQGLTFQFSMPLGVADRHRGEISARQTEYEQLEVEQLASRVELYAELHTVYRQLQQSRETARTLQKAVLPEAQQALELIEAGYRGGRFSYLELTDARQQRLSVEGEAIAAAVNFHTSLLMMERLTGEPLAGASKGASTVPAIQGDLP